MKTRTLLTTPPGDEPVVASARTGSGGSGDRYSASFALPEEPRVASRYRWLKITLVVAVLLTLVLVPVYRLWSTTQQFDPSVPTERSVTDPTDGLPGDG